MKQLSRFPWLVSALAALALGIHCSGASTLLAYDRALVDAGQWWRVITGPWTHVGPSYLIWDLLIVVVAGMFCEMRSRKALVRGVVASAVLVPIMVYFWWPELDVFHGLGSVACGLVGLALIMILRRAWFEKSFVKLALVLLVWMAFAGKAAFEVQTGKSLLVDTAAGFAVVPLAQLLGLAVGTLSGISWRRFERPGVPVEFLMRTRREVQEVSLRRPWRDEASLLRGTWR